MVDPLLTTEELSALLRTPKGSIYNWHTRGDRPVAVMVGRKLLFRQAVVVAWLDAQSDRSR